MWLVLGLLPLSGAVGRALRHHITEALMNIKQIAGHFIARKVRHQVLESGAYRAARNLKKQGYPLAVALLLIVGRV